MAGAVAFRSWPLLVPPSDGEQILPPGPCLLEPLSGLGPCGTRYSYAWPASAWGHGQEGIPYLDHFRLHLEISGPRMGTLGN